ncbi:MAG: hypothetical protein ACLRZO_11980, partial [Eggerthella lenta]
MPENDCPAVKPRLTQPVLSIARPWRSFAQTGRSPALGAPVRGRCATDYSVTSTSAPGAAP